MKRRAFTLLELLVVLAIVGVIAALLWPMINSPRQNARRTQCQSNLKQIGLALQRYRQDSNEELPPVASNAVASSIAPFAKPYGWADAIQPYLRSTQIYRCPTNAEARPSSEDATQAGFTDYWINTNVAAGTLKYFKAPVLTILCGDGNDGTDSTDARYHQEVLPSQWRYDEKSPARRHMNGANYLFVDGHVKWFKPDAIGTGPVRAGKPTFSIH